MASGEDSAMPTYERNTDPTPTYVPPHERHRHSFQRVAGHPSGAAAENIIISAPVLTAGWPVVNRESEVYKKVLAALLLPEWASGRASHWPFFLEPAAGGSSWKALQRSGGSFWEVDSQEMTTSDWAAFCHEQYLEWREPEIPPTRSSLECNGANMPEILPMRSSLECSGAHVPEILPMRFWEEGWGQVGRPWDNEIVRAVLLGTHDRGSVLSRLRLCGNCNLVETILSKVLDTPAAILRWWPRRLLDPSILEALALTYTRHCTAIQMAAIPIACSNRDLLCCTLNSAGKTTVS